MVKIRLQRLGRKKRPFYRIIAIDTHAKRQGAALAKLGYYNPLSRELKLDKVQTQAWLDKGAQATETVVRLLKSALDSGELIVLEKVRTERLSKKAEARLKAEAEKAAQEKAAAEAEKAAQEKAAAEAEKAAQEKAAAEAEKQSAEVEELITEVSAETEQPTSSTTEEA